MNKEKTKKTKEEKLTPEELLVKYHSVLIFLRMKNKTGQLIQTHQIKQVKKNIAQILTKQNQLKATTQSKSKNL